MTNPTYHPTQAHLARLLADATGIPYNTARQRVSRAVKAGEVLELHLFTEVQMNGHHIGVGVHTWIVAPEGWVEEQVLETINNLPAPGPEE